MSAEIKHIVPIDAVQLFPGNARKGNIPVIRDSLKRRGQYKPIVVSADGYVLAGNHTWQAAQQLGWTDIWVTIVPIKHDTEEAAEIVVVDNRSSDLGEYDDIALALIIQKINDAENRAIGYQGAEIRELLEKLPDDNPPTQLNDPDQVPELEEVPAICQPGDLWRLGPHLLRVGNCLDDSGQFWTVAEVLVTDPPYGVDYQSNKRKKAEQHAKINGDASTDLRDQVLGIWGDKPWLAFGTWKEPRPAGTGQVLIWDKGNFPGMGNLAKAFGLSHEEIYLSVKGWTKRKSGPLRTGSVLTTTVPMAQLVSSVEHPTPKPVSELMVPLLRVLPPGTKIADPFAGAGSTIIAAHSTGLVCRAMEIEPRYADLICQRYADHTGVKPVRLEPCDATWD